MSCLYRARTLNNANAEQRCILPVTSRSRPALVVVKNSPPERISTWNEVHRLPKHMPSCLCGQWVPFAGVPGCYFWHKRWLWLWLRLFARHIGNASRVRVSVTAARGKKATFVAFNVVSRHGLHALTSQFCMEHDP